MSQPLAKSQLDSKQQRKAAGNSTATTQLLVPATMSRSVHKSESPTKSQPATTKPQILVRTQVVAKSQAAAKSAVIPKLPVKFIAKLATANARDVLEEQKLDVPKPYTANKPQTANKPHPTAFYNTPESCKPGVMPHDILKHDYILENATRMRKIAKSKIAAKALVTAAKSESINSKGSSSPIAITAGRNLAGSTVTDIGEDGVL